MARLNLQLQPNEGVVLQNEDVARRLRRGHDDGTLVLTTKSLYFYKGHGKKAEITTLPLRQIKMIDGQPQAVVSGSKSKPVLQVFMLSGQVEEFEFKKFSLASNAQKEIEKWITSIHQLVRETASSRQATITIQPVSADQSAADSMQNGQNPLPGGTMTKVSGRCVGCMAPIFGNKGEMVRCKYCDTDQIL